MPEVTAVQKLESEAEVIARKAMDLSLVTERRLFHEIELANDVLNRRFDTVDVRFEENQRAVKLLQAFADRMPTPAMVDSDVKHLAQQTAEQISNLKILFDKTSELNNVALQAAFAAAKEAVEAAQAASSMANTKMETNFTKQIDGIGILLATLEKAITSKVDDVKVQVVAAMPRAEATTMINSLSDRVIVVDKAIINFQSLPAQVSASNDRLSSVEKSVANYQGALVVVGLLCTAIPTIIAILLNFLRH